MLLASLAIEEGKPAEGETLARRALDEFRIAKAAEPQIPAHAVLAQALLAQGKSGAAGKEITLGRPLAAKTQQRLLRLQFEIAAAEVRAGADLQSATTALNSVALEAEKRGIRGMVYEARLALGKAEMKYGNQAEGRERLAGVEKDAASSGFVLVARKAGAFREGGASDLRRRTSDVGRCGQRFLRATPKVSWARGPVKCRLIKRRGRAALQRRVPRRRRRASSPSGRFSRGLKSDVRVRGNETVAGPSVISSSRRTKRILIL